MYRTFTLSLLAAAALAWPCRAAEPDLKPQPVEKSRLVTPALPGGAARLNNTQPLGELLDALKKLATDGGFVLQTPEVLLWTAADYQETRGEEIKRDLQERLKKAGYNYQVAGEQKTVQGLVTVFATGLPGKNQAVLGSWTATPKFLLLAWGSITPKSAPAAEAPEKEPALTPPARTPAATTPPAPSGSSSTLTGRWGFTSISGTTYWDKSTGAYLGSGTGGSQTYTLLPDGKYRLFNYLKTRQYGWETQALTWEDGTYTESGGTLVFTPTSGKYQVIDNSVAKNNYTRSMTAEEVKKNARRFTWKLDRDAQTGKPVLLLTQGTGGEVKYRRVED